MTRAAALALALAWISALASTAHAAMLLAEIYNSEAISANGPLRNPQTFGLSAFSATTTATQSVAIGPGGVGQTFLASPSVVADFNEVMHSPGLISFLIYAFPFSRDFAGFEMFNGFFDGPVPDPPIRTGRLIADAAVPQLGPNFTGYTITSIEHTPLRYELFNVDGNQFVWAAHVVRFFGTVPEPSGLVLAVMVAALVHIRGTRPRS